MSYQLWHAWFVIELLWESQKCIFRTLLLHTGLSADCIYHCILNKMLPHDEVLSKALWPMVNTALPIIFFITTDWIWPWSLFKAYLNFLWNYYGHYGIKFFFFLNEQPPIRPWLWRNADECKHTVLLVIVLFVWKSEAGKQSDERWGMLVNHCEPVCQAEPFSLLVQYSVVLRCPGDYWVIL